VEPPHSNRKKLKKKVGGGQDVHQQFPQADRKRQDQELSGRLKEMNRRLRKADLPLDQIFVASKKPELRVQKARGESGEIGGKTGSRIDSQYPACGIGKKRGFVNRPEPRRH